MNLARTIMISLLNQDAENLEADLRLVEKTWIPATRHLFVKHDSFDTIQVFADIEYKAYVPKKYFAWNVSFTEWDGNEGFCI